MSFEQFTRCVEPASYRRRSFARMAAQAAVISGPFALIAASNPICLVIVAEIYGLAFLIAYCRSFLYERLICLGGDRDVIGVVAHISPPGGFSTLDPDDDYSINLLLENTEFGVTQPVAEATLPYGELISQRPEILALMPETPGYNPDGYVVHDEATGKDSATLHAEFEGAGVFLLMRASQVMLFTAIVAFALCMATPFPINLIWAGLVLLGFLLGWIGSKLQPGSPSDANPEIPTLHTNTESNDGHGGGADMVYVMGTWVYDPLHDGWNEIHPIKVCTIIGAPGGWDGDWPPPQPDVILRLRAAFQEARAPETLANQVKVENQWRVHPEIDGCVEIIIT